MKMKQDIPVYFLTKNSVCKVYRFDHLYFSFLNTLTGTNDELRQALWVIVLKGSYQKLPLLYIH
jgi:hypothetical protein